MRNLRFLAVLSCLVLVASAAAPAGQADTYVIDPNHSTVGFVVQHMVISKVRGRFGQYTAEIQYAPADKPALGSVQATIQAGSIDTDNDKRDGHLRSADFFDAEKFPTLTFESTKVELTSQGLQVAGKLTMHGVTHEVVLATKINGPIKDMSGKSRLGVEGRTTISRKDFGLTWNKALETGGVVVGDNVEIEIQAEFVAK
jgi:polyisoprenoid-binding protein YceI